MWRKWSFALCCLLMALTLGACGASATSSTINTSAQEQVLQSPFGSLQVSTQTPRTMVVGVSYVMRITLRPRAGYVALSDIPAEHATTTNTQPVAVGTPSASLLDAFGPGYEPYATAKLGAGSFTVQLISQETQSLRQTSVIWEWNVTPLSSGTQLIDGAITVEWTPTANNAHALPDNPTFTIATMDTAVTVGAAPATTQTAKPGAGVFAVGPFLIDEAGLTTTILGALIVAIIAWLSRRAYVRTRSLQRAAVKKRPPRP